MVRYWKTVLDPPPFRLTFWRVQKCIVVAILILRIAAIIDICLVVRMTPRIVAVVVELLWPSGIKEALVYADL